MSKQTVDDLMKVVESPLADAKVLSLLNYHLLSCWIEKWDLWIKFMNLLNSVDEKRSICETGNATYKHASSLLQKR